MQFPTESVLQHTAAVSDASKQMTQARSAVRELTMDGQAYGHLCQFLPGLLSSLFGTAVEVMNDAVDALEETAVRLCATATDMESADIGGTRRLDNAAGPARQSPL